MVNINISIYSSDPTKDEQFNLDIDTKTSLGDVALEASKKCQIPQEEIVLLHCGNVLNKKETIEEAGLATGDFIHCITSPDKRVDEAIALPESEARTLHGELLSLMQKRNKHAFFAHIQTPEFSIKAIDSVAGAWRDPDSLVLLQDPAILSSYARSGPELLIQLFKERPVVGRLAQYLMNVYRTAGPWDSTSVPTSAHGYSLDSLQEMDDNEYGSRRQAAPGHGSGAGSSRGGAAQALPVITPAQVAAALANVTGVAGIGPSHMPAIQPPHRGGHPSIPATPSNTPASHTSNTPSSAATSASASASHTPASASASTPHQLQSLPPITSEMLNSALQSVLGGGSSPAPPGGNSSPNTASASSPQPVVPPIPNMEESVRLMAEMGIPDEALSRQALQITNGDVQAAVDLVFAQLNVFD